MSAIPVMVLVNPGFFRMMFGNHVARLRADGVLDSSQADRWWAQLEARADSGNLLAGVLFFLVAATRP